MRFLPADMREPVSLAYLLARTSDTIADCSASVEERFGWLAAFETSLEHGSGTELQGVGGHTAVPGERALMSRTAEILASVVACGPEIRGMILKVVQTIVSGQRLDLEYFAGASEDQPAALRSRSELDDYAWRVAGCVGEFWTKIGFHTLGREFSSASEDDLVNLGLRYGKGLQFVNIIRDIHQDLQHGRCYLPIADPLNPELLFDERCWWIEQAEHFLADGIRYAASLSSIRLKLASGLPADLGMKTLRTLKTQSAGNMRVRVKIQRCEVYQSIASGLLRAFMPQER